MASTRKKQTKKKVAKKKAKKKPDKGGRPTIITEDMIEKVRSALMACAYIETAAAHVGIHKDTFYDWLKRGARAKRLSRIPAKERLYVRFSDVVEKALADAELRLLSQIDSAAHGGAWQAAAWRLERKYPDRWSRKVHGTVRVGEGEFETGKDTPKEAPSLDPSRPGELHITLAIGDKEIDVSDIE